jgi:hypothetical protein
VSGTIYLLDLDNRVIQRRATPAEGEGLLRRDGDPIDLLRLHHCEVGDDMILFLDLGIPGIDFTTRISTTVLRIERIRARFGETVDAPPPECDT